MGLSFHQRSRLSRCVYEAHRWGHCNKLSYESYSILERLVHLPPRLVRESTTAIQVVLFFLINRLGRNTVTEPGSPVVSLTAYGRWGKKVY